MADIAEQIDIADHFALHTSIAINYRRAINDKPSKRIREEK